MRPCQPRHVLCEEDMEAILFERKSIPAFRNPPSLFKKLEWQLAQELDKLEQQTAKRSDEEFETKLLELVTEYRADESTILAALQGKIQPSH